MLKLTRQIEDGIRKAGAEAYPNECCGILFGSEEDGNHVVKAVKAIDNARESGEQYHRFPGSIIRIRTTPPDHRTMTVTMRCHFIRMSFCVWRKASPKR